MKVIALLPFKNEQWCLPAYLHNTSKFVDEIIAIDDGSTDNSVKIFWNGVLKRLTIRSSQTFLD